MADPSHDPDIRHEPQLQPPATGGDDLRDEPALTASGLSDDDTALHSVHNEPLTLGAGDEPDLITRNWSCEQCGHNLRGQRVGDACPQCGHLQLQRPAPAGTEGYARWLVRRLENTSASKTWLVTLGIAVAAGPLAVLGTLLDAMIGGGGGRGAVLSMVVFAPAVEEVMKIALIAGVVERWPYLFRNRLQLQIAALASALVFAIIENIIYIHVYIPESMGQTTDQVAAFRWTVCTALHVTCTMVAVQGLSLAWHTATSQLRRPTLRGARRWLILAIILHGSYNGTVLLLEGFGLLF
jgi:hypothetical protein